MSELDPLSHAPLERPYDPAREVDGVELVRVCGEAVQELTESIAESEPGAGPGFAVLVWGPNGAPAYTGNRTVDETVAVLQRALGALHARQSHLDGTSREALAMLLDQPRPS